VEKCTFDAARSVPGTIVNRCFHYTHDEHYQPYNSSRGCCHHFGYAVLLARNLGYFV
jgi:hypothetical protein